MIFSGIFSFCIIIANLTIIIVISRNPLFPTSQLIYKLSLAFADILVGIFVVPLFAINLYIIYIGPSRKETGIKSKFLRKNENLTYFYDRINQNENIYYIPDTTQTYNNFFGFITFFSFFNSVFTLMFASIDRSRSLSHPLRFNKNKAVTFAKRIIIVVWMASLIFSLLPIIITELGTYYIVPGTVAISVSNETALNILGAGILLSFVVMWIFTMLVQINLKRQWKSHKNVISLCQYCNSTTEGQLSKTLIIMVIVFTVCTLPAIVSLTISRIIPSIYLENSEKVQNQLAGSFVSMELAGAMILASNSLWNAFIYSIRNKEFRKDARAMYHSIASALRLVALKTALSEHLCSC